MNAPERSEAPRETDYAQEHRATPPVHAAPQEHCLNGQPALRNPIAPHVPDEGAFETFVGGADI
jgi:hypothetical protein